MKLPAQRGRRPGQATRTFFAPCDRRLQGRVEGQVHGERDQRGHGVDGQHVVDVAPLLPVLGPHEQGDDERRRQDEHGEQPGLEAGFQAEVVAQEKGSQQQGRGDEDDHAEGDHREHVLEAVGFELEPVAHDDQDQGDGHAARELQGVEHAAGHGPSVEIFGQPGQVQDHAAQDGDDGRGLEERGGQLREVPDVVPPDEQQRQEREPDEEFVPQADDRDVADLFQPVGGAEQGHPEHAELEPRDQQREVGMLDVEDFPGQDARPVHDHAQGEDHTHDRQVGDLKLQPQEGEKQDRGQGHVDHQPLQPLHPTLVHPAPLAELVAEDDQQQNGQHLIEGGDGVVHGSSRTGNGRPPGVPWFFLPNNPAP